MPTTCHDCLSVNKMKKTDTTPALTGYKVHKGFVGQGEEGRPENPKGQSM